MESTREYTEERASQNCAKVIESLEIIRGITEVILDDIGDFGKQVIAEELKRELDEIIKNHTRRTTEAIKYKENEDE